MKRLLNTLVSASLIAVCLLAALSAKADLISKSSPEFENSDLYWNYVDYRVGKYLNIPFYFTSPYEAFAPIDPKLFTDPNLSSPTAPVLLNYRITGRRKHIQYPQNDLGLRLVTVNGYAPRKTNSMELAQSGLFEPGDIVLSFRREWYRTLRYSHIQLGISHAGLLYFEQSADGKRYLKNLDMPLDAKHVGEGYLNSEHYLGAPLLHVVRARNLTPKQKENINKWIQLLAKVGPKAYAEKKIQFNTDYSAPRYDEKSRHPMKFVGDLGRIALGIKNNNTLFNYCSEFAWSVLSLRNCDPDANRRDFQNDEAPSCLKEIFTPMPVLGSFASDVEETDETTVGLIDGIPNMMKTLINGVSSRIERSAAIDQYLQQRVFSVADNQAKNISSGHRAVEEAVLSANPQFYDQLLQYYRLVNDADAHRNPQVLGMRAAFNATQARNYSPTAFMVHANLPSTSKIKAMDYIATIFYATQAPMLDKNNDPVYEKDPATGKTRVKMIPVYPAIRGIRLP